MSLRAKLLFWYTGVFGIGGCVLVVTLYLLTAHRMQTGTDSFLGDEYEECVRLTVNFLDRPAVLEDTIRREIGKGRYFPLVYRLHSTATQRDILFLVDPDCPGALSDIAPPRAVPPERTLSVERTGEGRHPFRLFSGPVDPEGHPHLVIQVGMCMERLDRQVRSLRKYLFVVLATVLFMASLGGWFLASRSLRPIDDTVAELSGIESDNLARRMAVTSAGNEVDRLREAINRMLERLQAAFDKLQHFTADAAHELRTPLALLKCRLQVAVDRPRSEGDMRVAVGEALEQVAELDALLGDLLLLARMDAVSDLTDASRLDVARLLRGVSEPFAVLADQKSVALSVACEGEIACEGEAALLRLAFGNLLDNALRYTPAGGSVTIRAERDGDACTVSVMDTGIGIEPGALAHIFDRFYRADPSRSRAAGGTGLGLSIARHVVELHHGEIAVESTPGEGTRILVRLPHCPCGAGADPPLQS